jgi:NAD(P)H-dependent flavin oxidoreductase YrpB (nitropropane dioxygenase family)
VRSRSVTGKPARMLKNDWTEAWEKEGNPKPLPMPMQGLVSMDMVMRTSMYAAQSQPVAFNPVGQIVGSMQQVLPAKELVNRLIDDYVDAIERLQGTLPSD